MRLFSFTRSAAFLSVFFGIILGIAGCSNSAPSSASVAKTKWVDTDGNAYIFSAGDEQWTSGEFEADPAREGFPSETGYWEKKGDRIIVDETHMIYRLGQGRVRNKRGESYTFKFNGDRLEIVGWLWNTTLERKQELEKK